MRENLGLEGGGGRVTIKKITREWEQDKRNTNKNNRIPKREDGK